MQMFPWMDNRDAEFLVWKTAVLMSSLMYLDPSRWKWWHLILCCSGSYPNQDRQSSIFQFAAYWGMFSSLVFWGFFFVFLRNTKKVAPFWSHAYCSESLKQAGTWELLQRPALHPWGRYQPISDKLVTKLSQVEFTVDVWLMWSQVWPLTS